MQSWSIIPLAKKKKSLQLYETVFMKQILQNLKNGTTELSEIPMPSVSDGHLLIKTNNTLVSAGTEKMLKDFGEAGWIGKARLQPEKVRQVYEKMKTDGLQPTVEAVLSKLDESVPLGYCNVGQVAKVGSGVLGFFEGERVASNGKHAEVVSVPVNLCAKVPDNVSDEEAAFTVLGAVALQGIRLAKPTMGETFVVIGLGLVGLLTVQLLRANGCRVVGVDYDSKRLKIAKACGAAVVDLSATQDPIKFSRIYSRGRGVDSVIITASTTSSEPVHQAAQMCRKRGRIVLVGVTGLQLSRDDFYEKELTFQVSASYGPGRYDPDYEVKGQDYPVGFVRWTEQRNFEAVLDMMADGRMNVKPLISHRFKIDEAEQAYEILSGVEPSLGMLLEYPRESALLNTRTIQLKEMSRDSKQVDNTSISFLGAGSYAAAVLVPAFKAAGAGLRYVASRQGVSGVHVGNKFGFDKATTDVDLLFSDQKAGSVVIATRHNSHSKLVLQALKSGKHVFVEKPLCLTLEEVEEVEAAYAKCDNKRILMVGFNRRFAPQVQKIKQLLNETSGPKSFIMTINAGSIPANHWIQDREVGGGRIIGEACHFIDLLMFLNDSPVVGWSYNMMDTASRDTVSINLKFADSSVATVHYFANGSKAFPKERLEVFSGSGLLQLDNYRRLVGFGWPGFRKMNLWRQDKGQRACAKAFMDAVAGRISSPIEVQDIFDVSRICIAIADGNK